MRLAPFRECILARHILDIFFSFFSLTEFLEVVTFCFSHPIIFLASCTWKTFFFSLSRSAINCITSLLSPGGNSGCLTRLYFSGVCLNTTLMYTLYHADKASSGSV